jgi:hypothetical protein
VLMSNGMPRPAYKPANRPFPINGGCTFAEDPDLPAPRARVVWSAAVDPAIIPVVASPAEGHGRTFFSSTIFSPG